MLRFSGLLVSVLGLAATGCSLFPSGGGGAPPPTGSSAPIGCVVSPKPATAPGGYYVNGNTVCTAAGQAHLFHGVDRPSLEFSPLGQELSASDFQLMGSWKANVVRIALNQDYWLAASPLYSPTYATIVDQAINWAESAGMDVILDLHWSDRGVLGSCTSSCQQRMADVNSTTFWTEVAGRYKNDGRVLFELYNEPHDLTWGIWKSGGSSGQGWTAVGMQQLYAAVRGVGADNLVVIGGLNFAFDLSGVPSNRVTGYNIVYATHPYNTSGKGSANWDQAWGFLTATDPVIVTEFGDYSAATTVDGAATACPSSYSAEVITYADAHNASWSAWAWFVGGCTFPSLINDWNGTPNAPGLVVKTALAGYDDPAPGGTNANTHAGDAGTQADAAGTQAGDAGTHADDGGTHASDAASH